jgi:hypothetical protein
MATQKAEQVLEDAIRALERTTGLKAHVQAHDPLTPQTADALFQIETPQGLYTFLAEIKAVDRFATPGLVKARRHGAPEAPILIAPYITRETAEICKQLELPFIDTAGNAYIQGKGLLVYVVGQQRPPELRRDRFRALTPAGLQFTFAILCRPDLLKTNYRRMANAAKIAVGTVGPAMKDLQGRGILQVGPDETVRLGDPRRLLEEWVTHYPTTLQPKLNPRRFEADLKLLHAADLKPYKAFWGGEPAADRLTHMLRPAMFTIYAAGPWAPIAAAHRMRARLDGNVEILDAFWNFTPDEVDADLVPPPLVYADLLNTKDGRNLEVANLIYDRYIQPKFHHTP